MKPDLEVSLEVSKKMGEGLIREALSKRIEAQKAKVIGEVNTMMERLSVIQRLQEKTDRRVQFLKDQLDAVNSGKFIIEERTGRIKFYRDELNRDWNDTEQW